ncbi:MAG: hypothetical protein BAA03_05415 [Caldibacillus debilis]|nr:MAG: hypothetical protein BAA03_05415 [Caldibacillus debilis]
MFAGKGLVSISKDRAPKKDRVQSGHSFSGCLSMPHTRGFQKRTDSDEADDHPGLNPFANGPVRKNARIP